MAVFSYQAIDDGGEMRTGTLETEDISSVYNDLSEKGLNVVSVKQSSELFSGFRKTFFSRKVKSADVIQFAKNLSIMMRAGVPILTGLADIVDTLEDKFFKEKLSEIKRSTEMGSGFSGSISEHAEIFPDILVRLVKIGEETGQLDKSLDDVADHLQKIEDLKAAIKKALMYPAFVMTSTGGALLFWMIFVLPKILQVLLDMNVPLPLLTQMLVKLSDFLQSYWFFIPLIPAGAFAAVVIARKFESGRYFFDAAQLKIPILKLIIYNKLLALFNEQLRILIVAGLTIDRSFEIISEVINNAVFQKAINQVKDDISAGSSISDALKKHEIFPPLVLRMVGIGESSGSLDDQFGFLAEHYLKIVDDITGKLEKMIEPIVMVVVGGVFAVIMIGLMLPIYDLISAVGG